jgi:sigma-B regulation protein RsbU (phosphoserine phosphatase)
MSPSPGDDQNTASAYPMACFEVRGGNQSALFEAQLPGLAAWICCRPLQPATHGGDLYYLSVCSSGSISRVTLADVSGHGESVSTVAERLRNALRERADDWDQSALIRQLNDGFLKRSQRNQFATAFLLTYFAQTGELLFTNAGHLPPLWYKAGLRDWCFMEDTTPFSKRIANLPLGIIPGTSYTQTAVELDPGDLVLLYTDGVNEAENESGEQLGLDGLLQMARGLAVGSAAAAGEALVAAVERFRGAAPPTDDATIIAFQRSPGETNSSGGSV